MKKIASLLLSLGLLLFITSCGNPGSTSAGSVNQGGGSGSGGTGDDPLSGISITIPEVTLPDSVGENPFAGKSFTLQDNSEESDTATVTWSFTDSIATRTFTDSSTSSWSIEKYEYSYNNTQNLIYMTNIGLEIQNEYLDYYSYSSFSEYISLFTQLYKDIYPENMWNQFVEDEAMRWSAISIFKYNLLNDKINLDPYCDGIKPPLNIKINFNNYLVLEGLSLCLTPEEDDGGERTSFYSCTTFNDNIFSGKLLYSIEHWDDEEGYIVDEATYVGDIEGTYTISGEGLAQQISLTLIFTKLPACITFLSTGISYTSTTW